MKKMIFPFLVCLFIFEIRGFAAPITLNLFSGGLSLLDSLFLIAVGLILIGILLIAIAFLKPVPKNKPKIEDYAALFDAEAPATFDESDEMPSGELLEDAAAFEEEPCEAPDTDESSFSDNLSEHTPEDPDSFEDSIDETSSESSETLEDAQISPKEPIEEEAFEEEPVEEVIEEKIYPKLILTNQQNLDFVVLPLSGRTTIGRKIENDWVLSDTTVSGFHCVILTEGDSIYIQDEGSTNGTYLNGERISEKTELHRGDKLTIGQQEFSVSINE